MKKCFPVAAGGTTLESFFFSNPARNVCWSNYAIMMRPREINVLGKKITQWNQLDLVYLNVNLTLKWDPSFRLRVIKKLVTPSTWKENLNRNLFIKLLFLLLWSWWLTKAVSESSAPGWRMSSCESQIHLFTHFVISSVTSLKTSIYIYLCFLPVKWSCQPHMVVVRIKVMKKSALYVIWHILQS